MTKTCFQEVQECEWLYGNCISLYDAENIARQADASLASKDAEIARLREDAERYRWLRDSTGHARGAHPMDDHPPHCVFGKFDTDRHVNRAIYGEDLDKAVDAALAAFQAIKEK